MASLSVYPANLLKQTLPKPYVFSLQEKVSTSSPIKTLAFRSTEIIHNGDSRVYRGTLAGYASQEIKAVCKLVLNAGTKVTERFRREADMYETTLRDIQDHYIPHFYGLYTGKVSGDPAICIIVEDCGESVGIMRRLSYEWRAKAIEILMALHKRGIQHNDFHAGNIVVDNVRSPQRLVLIDFHDVTPHECGRKMDIALYQLPPLYDNFGCHELYCATEDNGVWTPPCVCIFGSYVDVDDFETPEELLRAASSYDPTYTYEQALACARTSINRYFKAWGHRKKHVLEDVYEPLSPSM